MNNKLHEGWKIDKLDKLVAFTRGSEPGSSSYTDDNSYTRFLRVSDISGTGKEEIYTTAENLKIINKGDLLITLDGTPGIISDEFEGAISSGIRKIDIVSKNLLQDYLKFYLRSENVQRIIYKYATGATILHASKSIQYINVVLPPIDNQKCIINIMKRAESALNKRKQAISLLDELVKSKFIEMFGSPSEKKFNVKTLPEIITDDKYSLKRGPFGGSLKKDDFIKEGYLVYEQRHAIHNDYDYAKYFISKQKYDEMIMFKVEPKDLLVSCSGVTLGRISEVPPNAKAGIINQALLKITLNQNIMNNIYFMQLFKNEQIQDRLFGFSRGSGIPNFPSMNEVKSMEFLCPPIELQNQFADFVKQVDKLKFEMEESLNELENNFNSLMQKAFAGELF